jgi:hypothetical protein
MTREELVALRDALDMTLALPENISELLAQWLAPAVPKPNGRDPHPPTPMPTPRAAKVRRGKPPISAKTAARKLLEAMKQNPNMSVVGLANAAGSSRSATGERLRQMALRGMVEKDLTGRRKLKGEDPGPQQPSPS